MLKEILSNNKTKNNSSVNMSMNSKEINKIMNNNLNNSSTFNNTLDLFNRNDCKKNTIDSPSKQMNITTKNTTFNAVSYNINNKNSFCLVKKDASVDSKIQSNYDSNVKSYLSLHSPVSNKKRRSSAKIIKYSKSQELNISNFVDNLKYLEDLITEIKSNGFESIKQVLHY